MICLNCCARAGQHYSKCQRETVFITDDTAKAAVRVIDFPYQYSARELTQAREMIERWVAQQCAALRALEKPT